MSATALLGGLASFGGSLFSQGQADIRSAEAFNRQKELMRLQNQYAVENWNRENAYNTPAMQKKRLQEAGLNPDLMYGNGAAGLQAGSIDSPSAPSAPMSPTMDFSKSVNDAVSAAVGMAQAENTKSNTVYQDILNKYAESQAQAGLESLRESISLTKEQQKEVIQRVTASQTEMDALQKRVGLETYDRFLSTLQIASTMALQNSQIELNSEQKRWIGTHAMAALIGAQGSYRQAVAIANAVDLFRSPDKLRSLIHDYVDNIKDELKGVVSGTMLGEIAESLELWQNGEYVDALFGKGTKESLKQTFKPSKNSSPMPHLRR